MRGVPWQRASCRPSPVTLPRSPSKSASPSECAPPPRDGLALGARGFHGHTAGAGAAPAADKEAQEKGPGAIEAQATRDSVCGCAGGQGGGRAASPQHTPARRSPSGAPPRRAPGAPARRLVRTGHEKQGREEGAAPGRGAAARVRGARPGQRQQQQHGGSGRSVGAGAAPRSRRHRPAMRLSKGGG